MKQQLRHWPLLVLLIPCAGSTMELPIPGGMRLHTTVASIKEMRFQSTLRQQYDFSCGSAALATLLTHHYNFRVSEQQVFQHMFMRGDQTKIRKEGFSMLDMQRYLAANGFKADGFQLPLQKLVEAKLPAIVLLSEHGYHHFVVIKGVTGDRVLVGDPSAGTRAFTREAFEAAWPSKLLFVIHGAPGSPRFNTPRDWVVAPQAPLTQGVDRSSLGAVTIPKFGPGDF